MSKAAAADKTAEFTPFKTGLVGRKLGMSRLFADNGESTPVTVIEVQPNRIVQRKTDAKEGYSAVQVTMGSRKQSQLPKAELGHFIKASVEAGCGLWELRTDAVDAEIEGDDRQTLTVAEFSVGDKVDVSGQSKGKGFQGGVKRHNFSMQDATHGNSLSHRSNGSIGQCQTPGRVFKGKKMSGRMGAEQVTTQCLVVVSVDVERNLLLIKGAVPGAPGGVVIVRPTVKCKRPRRTVRWN